MVIEPPANESTQETKSFKLTKSRTALFGLNVDDCIRYFFGGNALIAVIVLALITLFLFREGAGFFGQNQHALTVYRRAGLEFVEHLKTQGEDHGAMNRYLADLRLKSFQHLTGPAALTTEAANEKLADFDAFADRYSSAIDPLRSIASDLTDLTVDIKTRATVIEDRKTERQQYLDAGKTAEANAVVIETIDYATALQPLRDNLPVIRDAQKEFSAQLTTIAATLPALPTPGLQARATRFQELNRDFIATIPDVVKNLEQWDPERPVPFYKSITHFLLGTRWLTASFWQDWYGIVPLFVGSLMISIIALTLAVPLGVGAAIYINQIAKLREQRLIKPTIEFISAIPSVVLGFFGIAVLGEGLRLLSQQSWLSWFPGFPFAERLNMLTAGCLLGLIAVPTIFTLAEDAINNVPRAFKEASYALGASRLQTIIKIIVPASLSGIISAILLGFGRVIGETMVVLLCAGNRIAIPDFTAGLAVITQPAHTMTGIIAQEMPEVPVGGIHYRALFVVGLMLFFISLALNFLAQKIVRKYRISIG